AGTATVTATVTGPAGGACTCTGVVSGPITITVGAQSSCLVVVQPVVGPVIVGQPTSVTAVVTCNGLPVSGASVTFNGGAAPVTVTTNALGIATGSLTFNTAGTATVTATVTAPAGGACTCTGVVSAPITITVGAQSSCLVVVQPVVGPVIVGQPTSVTAVVTCNGLPVAGASVTFTGGAAPVTVTTNAAGIASGSLTFNTAGSATVTATVTAPAGTACACTGVVSLPLTITVSGPTSPTLQASPACWRFNLPFPVPSLFTATLKATLTPAQAGVTVTFYVSGLPVGTAVTNAAGVATLNAGLSLLQISASSYTAVATVGGATVQATGTLAPCFPPA
ncbi:Ig-like domain-containing protein, partial [Streptomyces decoyicus]